jgi:hypothetical protein
MARTSTDDDNGHITRSDVEQKVREFTGDLNETAERMTRAGAAVGAALLVIILLLVFLVGRGKGRKKTTVVEVIRI